MEEEQNTTAPDVNAAIVRAGVAVEAAIEAVNASQPGSDMTLSTDNAITTKARLAVNYGTVVKARAAAEEAALEAKKIIANAEMLLREKLKELEPLLAHAKRLEDGINAVNLYLGRDEFIETIQDGAPAAPGTPLTIRQTVLHMDEESALFAQQGGMDATNIGNFIEWMLSSPQNLDQVIPEQLGVVSLRPRRNAKEYNDPWQTQAMSEANQESFWLLRNGEQVYLHTTDFSVGQRLVPGRDEFTRMFITRGRDGVETSLEPGSSAWLNAEAAADLRTRHYMKIALILQGLIDRTTVFYPLPVAGLNILSQEHFDLGFVRIIADEELVLGVGRPTFAEWQKKHLASLSVGQRVLGYFPETHRKEDRKHITPAGASWPQEDVPHQIVREDERAKYITYDRTDSVWRRDETTGYDEYLPARTRATYRIETPWGIVSYLPVDGIDIDDLRYYLQSRQDRHLYRELFPAIKAAIAFIELEDLEEGPFRTLIQNSLISRELVSEKKSDEYARELITWWKTANKWHRALNGDGEHERKAQAGIFREAERRAGGSADEKRIIGLIRLAVPDAIAIAFRTNDFVAVSPQPRQFENAAQDVFVTVTEFTKTGKIRATKEWVTLTSAQVSRWSMLVSTDAFAALKLNVKVKLHVTDSHIAAAVETILAHDTTPLRTPVTISIREGAEGHHNPILFTVFTRSFYRSDSFRGGRRTLVQGKKNVGARVEKDGTLSLNFGRDEYITSDWTTSSPFERGTPQYAVAPHTVQYHGQSNPKNTVYRNEVEILTEEALGKVWFDESTAARVASDAGQSLYIRLCNDWVVQEEARVHARFMDDFQDESLWEGHKKALSQHAFDFPYRRTAEPAQSIDSALRALGHAIVKLDLDYHGKSVAELLPLTDVALDTELPADVLALSFAPLVSGTDVAVS